MKKYLLIIVSILIIQKGFSQQFPTFDWARVASEGYPSIPSVGTNYSSSVTIIKRDAVGNIYLAGGLNKAMKFNNQDIYAQDFNGSTYSGYLMKLNPTGETILWVKTMIYGDISEFDIGNDGFIYMVGLGSGGGTLKYGDATIAGGTAYPGIAGDALFYKINANNGNMVWIKKANSPSKGGANYPLIQTTNTAIYATDVLGPNANNSTTNRGYRLFKALKAGIDSDPDSYINNKSWILDKTWFRANVDSKFENFILDMKLTNDKQSLWLYLKTGDAWIDDFSGNLTDTRNMIVVRLDNLNNATPTVGFMKKFSTIICPDQGDLEIDSQGNVLLTGSFGTSPTRYVQNSNGKAEVVFGGITYEFPMNIQKQFIAKLSPTGAETWIKFYEPAGGQQFKSLTLDMNDNMYVCGTHVDVYGSSTIGSFTEINDAMWVMKMKPDGDQVYMWSNEEGGGGGATLCAIGGNDVIIGTNGGGGKYGTKEIVRYSSFVLSSLKHSGTTKPFEEFKRLKNINTGHDVLSQYSSHPSKFIELGGNLVFFAWGGSDLNNAGYLWKTDGTENGTTPLAAMYNGDVTPNQPYSGEIVKTPTHLYFEGQSKVPSTTSIQREIWKSDGTVAGTVRIKSFLGGTQGGGTESLYDILDLEFCNGLVYFTMTDNISSKIDLWKTDGTEAGTVRIYEGCLPELGVYNNFVYYFIKGVPDMFGNLPYTLRRHNGTSGGFVKNLATTSSNATNIPKFFGVVNNQLLFTADGTIIVNGNNVNSGMELWKTDGTSGGTIIVKDINPETSSNFPPGPFVSGKSSITYGTQMIPRYIIHNNTLYFGADNGANGRELWKSDGTEAGTVLIKDLSPGTFTPVNGNLQGISTDPYSFYVFQNNIVFTGATAPNIYGNTNFIHLFKTDGTSAGTTMIKNDVRGLLSYDYNVPMSYAVLNNNLYFSGKDQPNSLIHPTYNEPLTGEFNEIWVSDGTSTGTKQLKNLVKGWQVLNPMNFYAWNGSLYFSMYGAISPNIFVTPTESEPWKFTPAVCTNPAPAGPLATAPTILASYPATIKANGCLGIVKWYAAASGGSLIFTGDNYTTPLLNTTTTYYLSCTFNNCESQRSPATVTVNQPNCSTLPAVPSSAGGSVVNGNSITLSAVGCSEQTRWYGQASGGAILAQTPTFTTPVLTMPTTYYPVCFVLGCESPRTVLDNVTITPSSGQALDFDGIDDAVSIPANVGFNSLSFTIESYARFDINNRNQTIMDNSQRWMYYSYAQAGSSIKFGFADNGSPREAGFSFTPTAGTWYHLACTFNNATKECNFYVNGQLQDIQTLNFIPNASNTGMKLGGSFTATGYELDGRLEEARYWNITRTETQIGASYNTELSGSESGLVFYYKFDGNAQDCSPNFLHGTREGATGLNNLPQFFNTSVALMDVACGICIPPTPTIGSNSPLCVGGTLNLTSSGGVTYAWAGSDSFTSAVQNPSISNVTSLKSGTYTVTITNANACSNTATISIAINPVPSVTLTNNSPLCVGNTLNITTTNAGQSGFSGSFSAANSQYVNVVQTLPTDNFTIEMMIKTSASNTGLLYAGNPSLSNYSDRHIFVEGGILKVRIIPQAGAVISSGVTVNDNNWHHVAITHTTTDGVGTTIFIDGVSTANYPTAVTCVNVPTLYLGTEIHDGSIQNYYTGLMDNVRIWNVVRTNAEITANKNLENPISTTGMIYQQKFENNVNATVGTNGTTPNGLSYVGNTYKWSGPNSFTSTVQSPSIANVTASVSGTYTVNVTGVNGCAINATTSVIINSTAPPTANGITITSGSTASITASGCTTYKWYSVPTGGSVLFTGNPFVSPPLTTNTTYYVACLNAPCPETSRTSVLVTIGVCTQMISVKTGAWNDPTVWSCNRIPNETDNITIEIGHVVTVPAGTFNVKNITDKGTLSYALNGILNLVGGY